MSIKLQCPQCHTWFNTKPSEVERGRTYCSRGCWDARSSATKHELYHTWENIRARTRKHHRYAGRDIGLHGPWQDARTFIRDVEREIGPRPRGHTLDRIDNDSGYEPGNIRWATRREQQHNRGQRGTSQHKDGGWVAQITREYQHYYIGYFTDEESAHQAYLSCKDAYRNGGTTALLTKVSSYRR